MARLSPTAAFAFLSLVELAVSCGKNATTATTVVIPDEVAPYVKQFTTDAAQYGHPLTVTNLIIEFGPLENANERGICDISGDLTPKITIDRNAWDKSSDGSRDELIHHEMGHCVLRRKHKTGVDDTGKPDSIMYPYAFDGQTYDGNRVDYLTELYSGKAEF